MTNRELAEELRGLAQKLKLPVTQEDFSTEVRDDTGKIICDKYDGWHCDPVGNHEIMLMLNNLPTIIEALEK